MESLKNIDSAYKLTKKLAFFAIAVSMLTNIVVIFWAFEKISQEKDKIYVLINNEALEIALLKDVDSNRKAEIINHSEMFHNYFFELDPDMETIKKRINRALILGDNSIAQIHSQRNEKLYYHNLIKGGISTEIITDKVEVDISSYPYKVIFHGKQRIIRPSNITIKEFVASFKMRNVKRTENNPHGLYIEGYKIINHKTISSHERK